MTTAMGKQVVFSGCISNDNVNATAASSSLSTNDEDEGGGDGGVDILDEFIEQEMAFCSEKINENFSNFSAFHYRSELVSMIWNMKKKKGKSNIEHLREWKEATLSNEIQLVENAIFTEPDECVLRNDMVFVLQKYQECLSYKALALFSYFGRTIIVTSCNH